MPCDLVEEKNGLKLAPQPTIWTWSDRKHADVSMSDCLFCSNAQFCASIALRGLVDRQEHVTPKPNILLNHARFPSMSQNCLEGVEPKNFITFFPHRKNPKTHRNARYTMYVRFHMVSGGVELVENSFNLCAVWVQGGGDLANNVFVI